MINLEESYYAIKQVGTVDDCDHGEGTEYTFTHNNETWCFTFYPKTKCVSLLNDT